MSDVTTWADRIEPWPFWRYAVDAIFGDQTFRDQRRFDGARRVIPVSSLAGISLVLTPAEEALQAGIERAFAAGDQIPPANLVLSQPVPMLPDSRSRALLAAARDLGVLEIPVMMRYP